MVYVSGLAPSCFQTTSCSLDPETELKLFGSLFQTTTRDPEDAMAIGRYRCAQGCHHFVDPGSVMYYPGGQVGRLNKGEIVPSTLTSGDVIVGYMGELPRISCNSRSLRGKVIRPNGGELERRLKELGLEPGTIVFWRKGKSGGLFFPYLVEDGFSIYCTDKAVSRKEMPVNLLGGLPQNF